MKANDVEFYIDLVAERLVAALGMSAVTEFHLALGQILNYRLALKKEEPERIVYLVIPQDTYEDFFSRQFIQNSVAEYQIKLLIFDSIKQEVI